MIIMHLLDQIDPYPLVLKRWSPPAPPSQADVWFDEEFRLLREAKKGRHPDYRKKMEENLIANNKLLEKLAGKKIPEPQWLSEPPVFPGTYMTRRKDESDYRPRNREFTHQGWMVIRYKGLTAPMTTEYQDQIEWLVGSRT